MNVLSNMQCIVKNNLFLATECVKSDLVQVYLLELDKTAVKVKVAPSSFFGQHTPGRV
jgi:hypothetical protein